MIANVGRRGIAASKKCTGKLLEMPPSENQHGVAIGARPAASRSRLALLVQSTRCSGTALSSTGKLRLMRVATTTGRSSAAGSGRSGSIASASSPVGGGCASMWATTRSGNSARNSTGSNQNVRSSHGSRLAVRFVTFVVIISSRSPARRSSPNVSGPAPPPRSPARPSIRSVSHGVSASGPPGPASAPLQNP